MLLSLTRPLLNSKYFNFGGCETITLHFIHPPVLPPPDYMKTTISRSVSSFETLPATESSAVQTGGVVSSSPSFKTMFKDRSSHRSTSAARQTNSFQEKLKTAMMREGYARNRRASGSEVPGSFKFQARTSSRLPRFC